MDKKVERIIKLYSRFLEGKVINKKEEAERFEVNQRTIQRDIDDIRMYFANDMNVNWQVVYKRNKNGYILIRDTDESLNSQEILMLCEVFLQSKLLIKEEMFSIVDKLVQACVSQEEKKKIISLLAKEKMKYEGPEHGKRLQQMMKDISDAIYRQHVLQISYLIHNNESLRQVLQPLGIVFSGKHLYLTAYAHVKDDDSRYDKEKTDKQSIVCRLDRIKDYKVLQEHFHVPYKNRYTETDFHNLIQREIAATEESS